MNKYVIAKDATFIEIQNNVDMYWDDKTFCTVEQLVAENRLEEFSVVVYTEVAKPIFDPKLQKVVKNSYEYINGVLHERWAVLLLTEEEQEAYRLQSIPKIVSPRQIRQALTRSNLREQVELAVQAGDQDTKDWWEFATQIERNHPMVISIGTALGQSERELDDLFTLAGTL